MPHSQAEQNPTTDALRTKWTTLYRTTLPSLAKSRNPSQPSWPVTLDHCFARIILDNTIGRSGGSNRENLQWDSVIEKPAVRNMSEQQLKKAIELGEKIASGQVDLTELDQWSLEVRGKSKVANQKRKVGGEKPEDGEGSKRRKVQKDDEAGQDTEDDQKQEGSEEKGRRGGKRKQAQSTLSFRSSEPKQLPSPTTSPSSGDTLKTVTLHSQNSDISNDSKISKEVILATLHKIQTHPGLTPFRKRLYTSLLSVPTGQHTTYAALASHLGSIPRAVGNGMRNNPFAPEVPCHRVLASDGTLGGFFGDWGVDGKYGNKKIRLLEGEGVTFNSGGKVKGLVWDGFWDLRDFERQFGKVK